MLRTLASIAATNTPETEVDVSINDFQQSRRNFFLQIFRKNYFSNFRCFGFDQFHFQFKTIIEIIDKSTRGWQTHWVC